MANWHFAPWTIQYLIGSAIVIFVLITLLRKKIRSYVYYVFYFFSMSIIMWLIFAFLHRNTSTAKFSKIFFSLDLFFVSLIIPFMLLMFLYLKKKKKWLYPAYGPAETQEFLRPYPAHHFVAWPVAPLRGRKKRPQNPSLTQEAHYPELQGASWLEAYCPPKN